ncbi:hypothetical protein J2777_002398 [Paraburkholderia graminis]|nr:hypothetical protein [Paraburkholderia graminis]
MEYDAPVFSDGIRPQVLVTDLRSRVNPPTRPRPSVTLAKFNMTRPATAILSLFVTIGSVLFGFPVAMVGFHLHPREGKNCLLECSSERTKF